MSRHYRVCIVAIGVWILAGVLAGLGDVGAIEKKNAAHQDKKQAKERKDKQRTGSSTTAPARKTKQQGDASPAAADSEKKEAQTVERIGHVSPAQLSAASSPVEGAPSPARTPINHPATGANTNNIGSLSPPETQSPIHLDWLKQPVFFWPVAGIGLSLLLLLPALVYVSLKRRIDRLMTTNRTSHPTQAEETPDRVNLEREIHQLSTQYISLESGQQEERARWDGFLQKLKERDGDLRRRLSETAESCLLLATRMTELQVREARLSAKAAPSLDPNLLRELQSHTNAVKSLEEKLDDFLNWLKSRQRVQHDMIVQLAELYYQLHRLPAWEIRLKEQASAATADSPFDQTANAGARKLYEQVMNGQYPLKDYIEQCGRQIEQALTMRANAAASQASAGDETELRHLLANAKEFAMNWFDEFHQLSQNLLIAGQGEGELEARLKEVRRAASEWLRRYDIQPEEVPVGETSFDSRLHELAFARHSDSHPVNTVIGVPRCGFRDARTAEVLRRPQVIVSGGES
ncbi:MAG: hypothetical protein ACREEM_06285 [Blastocatellia bacterium]